MTTAHRPSLLQVRSSAGLYGADRVVLMLNKALAARGERSRLLSINNYRMTHQALHEEARAQGQSCSLLACRGRVDPQTSTALAAHILHARPTLVHAHDYKSAFYAWLASRRQPAALVATLHGWVESSGSMRVYNRLELALLRRFDAVVVVTSQQVERLLTAGISRDRIHQVDNGIQCAATVAADRPRLRRDLQLAPTDIVFAAVGRLAPEKNLPALLDQFAMVSARCTDARLLVVGDGPQRSALEARARQLDIAGKVRFTGVRTDMQRIYPVVDCLVLPSLSEGLPLVLLEAMGFQIPVIATAVGDIPRVLVQSDHGQVLPVGDDDALQRAMQFAADHPRRRDARARDYVHARHTADAMADRYLAVYDSLGRIAHERRAS